MRRIVIFLCVVIAAGVLYLPSGAPSTASAQAGASIGRVRARFQPTDGKVFVLIIGSDARTGNPDRRSTGPDINADGIHLAGINAKTMKGGILNFPRDAWVPVPGYGSRRINDALNRGGPRLLVQTIENLTGIKIDYWVMTGFQGFQGAIGDLGGVRMNIPSAIHDPGGSGANLRAGEQRLAGYQALAYMRTRKSFRDGDVSRTTNQGRFLLALLKKFRTEMEEGPTRLFRWMDVTKNRTSTSVGEDELFRLAILASQVRPKDVSNVTIPVAEGRAGAAEVVFIQSGARSIYARFRQQASL
jgi:LCP family protein required for cell wall assembly